MKKGKKYSDSLKLIDRTKLYDPEEGHFAGQADRQGQVRRDRGDLRASGC